MARGGRRRRAPADNDDDYDDELDGDFEEDDEYERAGGRRPPPARGTNPLVWLFPVGALLLLVVAIVARTGGGRRAGGGKPELNERYMPPILRKLHEGQQIYWRDMWNPKQKVRHFAESFADLAFKYKEVHGAPIWETRWARADCPERAYRGYYFVNIKRNAAGEAWDYRKDYAAAAVPADYGTTGYRTFIVNQEGIVYAKDTGGECPETWPTESEFRLEGGWEVE